MVTHTRNYCSAFIPSKVHTHIHTHREHTSGSGQPFMLRSPGSSWGFSALLKGTSVVVLRVENAPVIHSPHRQSLPVLKLEPATFLAYKSYSLTIRPRLLLLSPTNNAALTLHNTTCSQLHFWSLVFLVAFTYFPSQQYKVKPMKMV